jgi:hypothetical protein
MGLFAKHPTNLITLKLTSTPFPGNKNKKGNEKPVAVKIYDAPPNSLKDSNVSLKMKMQEKGVGVCSLPHNTLGVKKAC